VVGLHRAGAPGEPALFEMMSEYVLAQVPVRRRWRGCRAPTNSYLIGCCQGPRLLDVSQSIKSAARSADSAENQGIFCKWYSTSVPLPIKKRLGPGSLLRRGWCQRFAQAFFSALANRTVSHQMSSQLRAAHSFEIYSTGSAHLLKAPMLHSCSHALERFPNIEHVHV